MQRGRNSASEPTLAPLRDSRFRNPNLRPSTSYELQPKNVGRVEASRMRLDATLAPGMHELRLNRGNLLNEMRMHNGKVVSHQFTMMRPMIKKKLIWQKPQDLEPPPGCNRELFRLVAERRARQKLLKEQQLVADLDFLSAPALEEDIVPKGPARRGSMFNGPVDAASRPDVLEALEQDGQISEVFGSLQTDDELANSRISRALEALGLVKVDASVIEATLRVLARSNQKARSAVNLYEFTAVVLAVRESFQVYLRQQFEALDSDGSGSVSKREFMELMWELGYTVGRDTVNDLFKEIDSDGSGQIDLSEFEEALRIVYDRHGFTQKEVEELFSVFDKYDSDKSGEISAIELASALGFFGTPTTISQARAIIARYDEDADGTLCRPEFLVIMRARLEEEISEMRHLFSEVDRECNGSLSADELLDLLQRLGYLGISLEVICDGIKELGMMGMSHSGLIFEDVLRLLYMIRKREGLSKHEVTELLDIYKRFDTTGGNAMRDFELARALNWLGYPLSHQRRQKLWVQIDVDKSDSIDSVEFLKLVRLLREGETSVASQFLADRGDAMNLGMREFETMLNSLGYAPSPSLLDQALKQSLDSDGNGAADLGGILSVLKFIREGSVLKLRESAGLSDEQANKIRGKFRLRLDAGKRIDPADFEKFMYDLYKTARYELVECERIKKLIEEHATDGGLGLMEAFWVVRLYGDMRNEDVWRREKLAAESAGLSPTEVAQFREKFVLADADGSGALSDGEIKTVFDDVMDMTDEQTSMLQSQLARLGSRRECIDFPEFLRLMGTVLDISQ